MEEEKYIIIRIDEDDYGCEARPDDYVPMVKVLLRSVEPDAFGDYREEVILMEDSVMYARNLDEGNEAVIGVDGELYPPERLFNQMNPEEIEQINRQNKWIENYFDAVEEMNE